MGESLAVLIDVPWDPVRPEGWVMQAEWRSRAHGDLNPIMRAGSDRCRTLDLPGYQGRP